MPVSHPKTSFDLMKLSQVGVMGPIFDLSLDEDGGPKLVEGSPQLGQSIELRLRANLGEFWEDINCGMPWRETLLGMKPANRNVFRMALMVSLRRDPRVLQIESLTIEENLIRRTLSAKVYVKARDGSKIVVNV